MTPDLEGRIASAFTDRIASSDVSDLIREAEAAVVTCDEAAERSHKRALDPALSAAAAAAARRDSDDAAFARDRMHEAVRQLGLRLRELKREEEEARRREAYDAAVVERDALAAELAEVYPSVAERLADLAARIAANDAIIERVNLKSLPHGAKWLDSAELIARKLSGFHDGTASIPRITQHLRLPAFRYEGHKPYAWPRIGAPS